MRPPNAIRAWQRTDYPATRRPSLAGLLTATMMTLGLCVVAEVFSLGPSAAAAAAPAKAKAREPAASPRTPTTAELIETITAATKALMAALPADLVKAHTFAWGGPEHRYWHWVPNPLLEDKALGPDRLYAPYGRFGVPVEKMDNRAVGLLHELLRVSLSGEGYRKVQLIIRQEGRSDPRQGFRGLDRSATSRPPGGPDWYFVSFFGEVGSPQWAWRFEGHHVSLTYEIDHGRLRFSPSMIGFNPSPLPPRSAELAMQLFESLPEDMRQAAHVVREAKTGVPGDCTRSVEIPAPVGAKLAGLPDQARWYLMLLIEESIGNYPETLARDARHELHGQIGEMTFAWFGPLDHAQPHLYRLQGPGCLIEMRHQGGGMRAAHIHGVYRRLSEGSVTTAKPSGAGE